MQSLYKSKYHRDEPVIGINPDQTLYDAVFNINSDNMDANYSSYFGEKKTFNDLKRETDVIAFGLKDRGIKADDIVGILSLTVPEVMPSLLSSNKLGCVSYFFDIRTSPEDLIHYFNDFKIKAIFVTDQILPVIQGIKQYTQLETVIVLPSLITDRTNKSYGEGYINYYDFYNKYNSIITNYGDDIIPSKYDREKDTIIVQSSGSTGAAKSILHSDYNFNSEIERMAYTDLPFYRGKRAFVCAPPWVIYGLCNSIYSGLLFGAETVYSLAPDEPMIYNNLGNFDYAYGVPVYYRYLYNKIIELEKSNDPKAVLELQRVRNELYKVSAFISGGDKISELDTISWQQKFMTPIANGYGNNEVTGAAICSPIYANKPGSIGVAMHDNVCAFYDEDTDKFVTDGSLGELIISSDHLFKGYVNNESEYNKILKVHDGKKWVHTGDLGYVDKDGFIFITGRTRRLIIDKLGYKISPDNIENFINSLSYVKECVVVGVARGENDNVPIAFIELKDEYKGKKDILDIISLECPKKLKDYELPVYYREIDKIPHKENGGKVNFLELESIAKDYVAKEVKGNQLEKHCD